MTITPKTPSPKTKTPEPPSSLTLEKARLAARVTKEQWAKGLLTAAEVHLLQYPWERSEPDGIRNDRKIFLRLLQEANLPTKPAQRTKQKRVTETVTRLRKANWVTEWGGPQMRLVTCEESRSESEPVEVDAYSAEAVRGFLDETRIRPNELLAAWLWPIWQEESPKVGAGDAAPTENSKRQKLRTMLERIEGLDPGDMPGQKIDFHALALAHDKDFQVSPATFSDYLDKPASLPKLCTFGQGAERNPDYYRSICNQVGVTAADYNRAMNDLEKQKASAKAKKGDGGNR